MKMTNEDYKQAKLAIFESADAEKITVDEKKALLTMLEEAKEKAALSKDEIKNFFDALAEQFPDAAEDVEKLQKKLDKAEEAPAEDEKADEGEDEKDDEKKDPEEDDAEVSEAAIEIAQVLHSYM